MATTVRALLLAAGLGTRLRPLTDSVPKCLVPVGGRSLLDYWIDALAAAGVRKARINTHHLADAVRAKIAEINRIGDLTIEESFEPELLGSAGTVTANRDFADGAEQLFVVYADNLSDVDLNEFIAFHRAERAALSMLLFHAPNPSACGIASLDADGTVTAFVEKPEKPDSDLANAGVYALTADAYREIADMRGHDIGFDVLPKFVLRMKGFVHDGYHRDIGTLEALREAERELAEGVYYGRPAN